MQKNNELVIHKILQDIANEENITLTSLCDGWIHDLEKKGIHRQIYGYKLGCNDDCISELCSDKSAVSELLLKNSIPSINHIYIPKEDVLLYMNENKEKYIKKVASLHKNGNCVIKPNFGTGGRDVYFSDDYKLSLNYIEKIHTKGTCACISQYEEIQEEIRCVVIYGNIEILYRKERTKSWKHNLSFGAKPIEIEINDSIKKLIYDINKLIKFNVASVDIIKTKDVYKLLEINTGLMMENFAKISLDNYNKAKDIYKKCILKKLIT